MKYLCKSCRTVRTAADSDAGKTVRCPDCGKETIAPAGIFAPGSVIADFEILSHLATGDMGEIYCAEHITTGEKAAVKVLFKAHTCDAKFIVSFVHNGRLAMKKPYPNTTKVLGVGEEDGIFYFAMEYVEGVPLSEILKKDGALPLQKCLKIVKPIAETLAKAWKNDKICHRNIKPDNILVLSDGSVKLADFGLEWDFLDLSSRTDEEKLRLIQYAPPELISDFSMASLNTRSDIYALGAVFYHAVTGQYPYQNFSLSEIISGDVPLDIVEAKHLKPDLPLKVSEILQKMLARNPKERYKDFNAVLNDLNSVVPEEEISEAKASGQKSETIKIAPPKRAKMHLLDEESSASRLDNLRKKRESRSQTIVIGIISILLVLGISAALFVKWLVHEPQRSAREMEINISRMKERKRGKKSLYQPLQPGSVERLCRGVIAHCANEDYQEAQRFINSFTKRYHVDNEFKTTLSNHVRKAQIFFRQFTNSGGAVSGIRFYSRLYGYCDVLSVKDSIITAQNKKGETVSIQIRTFTHEEYASYLREIVKRFNLNHELYSYLLCTGNFELALKTPSKTDRNFFEKVIYGYIRVGLSNASPLEIRQMRMLYGSLDAFQKATHPKK